MHEDLEQEVNELRQKLKSISGRLIALVIECEATGVDPSYLFSMLDTIDPKIVETALSKETN